MPVEMRKFLDAFHNLFTIFWRRHFRVQNLPLVGKSGKRHFFRSKIKDRHPNSKFFIKYTLSLHSLRDLGMISRRLFNSYLCIFDFQLFTVCTSFLISKIKLVSGNWCKHWVSTIKNNKKSWQTIQNTARWRSKRFWAAVS